MTRRPTTPQMYRGHRADGSGGEQDDDDSRREIHHGEYHVAWPEVDPRQAHVPTGQCSSWIPSIGKSFGFPVTSRAAAERAAAAIKQSA